MMANLTLFCPGCQALVHPQWPYCTHCGADLGHPIREVPLCATCGAFADTAGSFCWQCGATLVVVSSTATAHPASASSPPPSPSGAVPRLDPPVAPSVPASPASDWREDAPPMAASAALAPSAPAPARGGRRRSSKGTAVAPSPDGPATLGTPSEATLIHP